MTHASRAAHEIAAQEALRPGEESTYRLYEDWCSPFSAKVRAYLHYKELPYRRLRTTFGSYMGRITELVGFPILPVLLSPDGDVVWDSTPLIHWLEARHPEPSVIPSDPRVAFLADVLDDFADEYVVRYSMHFRWGTEPARDTLGHRLARRMSYGDDVDPRTLAAMVITRQSGFDAHLGLEDATRAALDAEVTVFLGALDAALAEQSYLLGERPSLADFALYGQLQAHLFNDPVSMRVIETQAPRTATYLEEISELGDRRGAVGRRDFGPWASWEDAQRRLAPLLGFVATTWLPLSAASAEHSIRREKRFDLVLRGTPSSFSTSHYRAWSFESVQNRLDALPSEARRDVSTWLSSVGDFDALLTGPRHRNGLFNDLPHPVVRDGIGDRRILAKRGKRD